MQDNCGRKSTGIIDFQTGLGPLGGELCNIKAKKKNVTGAFVTDDNEVDLIIKRIKTIHQGRARVVRKRRTWCIYSTFSWTKIKQKNS